MRITYKAKPVMVYDAETNEYSYTCVPIPTFKRSHVDMNAARRHPKYGAYANSDLFPNMLAGIRASVFGKYTNELRLDKLPPNVTVTKGALLVTVTITVE